MKTGNRLFRTCTKFMAIIVFLFALTQYVSALPAAKPDLSTVKVVSVQRVFDNGEHNAFTDLCRFQGRLFLTFRSCPDGHMVHPTASILVLASKDGTDWKQVHRFHVPKRDTRDPHFLIFKDKLFVITGTWYCGDRSPKASEYDLNKHLGYAVWTRDGGKWHGPQMLEGTYGHYVWRAAAHGDKAYLCGRRIHEFAQLPRTKARPFIESAMLESDDGLIWRKAALFQEKNGDETAFLFEKNGAVLAVARRGSGNAQLCRSEPPYRAWQRRDLDEYIGGPLLVKWGQRYLVGGRKRTKRGYKTVLYWLHNDQLHQIAELPSGGDNSYPGFVPLSETRALVSYYSSHEKDEKGKAKTAIYLSVLEMAP